jgi:hypothetical protein
VAASVLAAWPLRTRSVLLEIANADVHGTKSVNTIAATTTAVLE